MRHRIHLADEDSHFPNPRFYLVGIATKVAEETIVSASPHFSKEPLPSGAEKRKAEGLERTFRLLSWVKFRRSDYSHRWKMSAQKVFVSYCHEDSNWASEVLRFSDLLRENGVDSTIDQYSGYRSRDWALWGPQQVDMSDIVVCVGSPGFVERWARSSGSGVSDEGRAIRQKFSVNPESVVFVLLPGRGQADIPSDLRSWNYFSVLTLDSVGIQSVVARCTDQSLLPKPPIGSVPNLQNIRRSGAGSLESVSDQSSRDKIVAFVERIGDDATLGLNIERGVRLAIDIWNRSNADRPIRLQTFETSEEPGLTRLAAERLVTDKKVLGVVGPGFSRQMFEAMPIFQAALIPCVTPCATNSLLQLEGWSMFNRVIAHDTSLAPALVRLLEDYKAVAIIDDGSGYGHGLAAAVRAGRNRPLDISFSRMQIESNPLQVQNVLPQVSAVVYGGYFAEAAQVVRFLRESGFRGAFVTVTDASISSSLIWH
jgi:Periplasmic binding protein/TIR domain